MFSLSQISFRSSQASANPRRQDRRRALSLAAIACGVIVMSMCNLAVAGPTKYWKPKYKRNSGTITTKYWWTNTAGSRCNADGSTNNVSQAGSVTLAGGDDTTSIALPAAANDVSSETNLVENHYVVVNSEGLKRDANNAWITDLPGVLDDHSLSSIDWPSFFQSPDTNTLYVGVDVNAFYLGGAPQFDTTHTFNVTNGVCPQLPGYVFGTSPVSIDPTLGFVTANPLTDTGLIALGTEGVVAAVPEPSACGSILAATAFSLARRRRRVRLNILD